MEKRCELENMKYKTLVVDVGSSGLLDGSDVVSAGDALVVALPAAAIEDPARIVPHTIMRAEAYRPGFF